jgi:formate-dependent phosphoribosylglycinamide formyltransferase (GAR transformylase)
LLLPSTTYRTGAFLNAARILGVDVTVASEHPSTLEKANPAGLLTVDFRNPAAAAETVRDFAREHPVHAVVGVDDDSAVVAAAVAERLGLKGNPERAAAAARDKHRQRVLLAAAGVPVPRFELQSLGDDPERIAKAIAYPCVLKPLNLSASRGVIRANNPREFAAAHARLGRIVCEPPSPAGAQFLVEEFIPGYEVALEGLLVNRRLHVLALFDKPDPLDGPFFEETIYLTPSRVPAGLQLTIVQCAERAAKAIGLVEGPVHAELRYNERGAWLIEMAARPIGGRCSAVLRFGEGGRGKGEGSTLEEIVLRHALGMPIPSLERESRAAGVMMIPIPGAGTLKEVRGLAEAKAVPLVEDVQITAHPGEVLVPFPEGSRYPGFIFARGDTPAAVEGALREAHRRLTFVLA